MLLTTLLMVPTVVLILGFVALWGEIFGGFVALTGMLTAAHLYFLLGRIVGLPFLSSFQTVRGVLAKVKAYGFWGVALTRIIPTGPFVLVNLATGSIGFKWSEMLLGSLVGLLPGVVLIAVFSGLFRYALAERSVISAVLVVTVGILYLGVLHYVVKLAQRAVVRIKQQRGG